MPTLTALTLTVHVTGMMMDTMKGLDVADMMTESMTDHGEPDMNPGIRVPVVGGKEIAPGIESSPQHTGRTSGSPVRPSVPDYSSQVPQPPQRPRTTSTTEDEQVVSILVQMYPML